MSKVIEVEKIKDYTNNNFINLILTTILRDKKQVLIFNRSKNSSEKTAEDIAKAISEVENEKVLTKLSEEILNVLETPTKQCEKLASLVKKGVAFHHSGLVSKQRELIEDSFRNGLIRVISATPTLASGLNLPAYKVVIKDYKRYSKRGLSNIPVLEYHQMSGRAGRPGFEKIGKAVLVVNNQSEEEDVVNNYIFGKPEEVISKLAVEPVLKMYLLNLISIGLINKKEDLENFFLNTFYAFQFEDRELFRYNLNKIINILKSYQFIEEENGVYFATAVGKKVNQLYLNPDTGYFFLSNFDRLKKVIENLRGRELYVSIFHFISNTIEMKPLFSVIKKEEDSINEDAEHFSSSLIVPFDPFEDDIFDFLKTIKIAMILVDWINEVSEESISSKYNITPGELRYKLDIVDWLLYSLEEIANSKKEIFVRNFFSKLRLRLKYGIKEELVSLVSVKGIGRVTARKLFEKGIKNLNAADKFSNEQLTKLVGPGLAKKLKGNFNKSEKDNGIFDYESKNEDMEGEDVKKNNLLDFI